MKILILGATGMTGQLLVKLALEKSHQVTALVRSPTKLNIIHENLNVIKGDILDNNILKDLLKDKDAVLSALGVGKSLKSGNLMTRVASVLIPSMHETKVKRLIFLSAFGVGETFSQANFIQKLIFRLPLKNIYRDKSASDSIIKNSKIDWTLICPTLLTNGPFIGEYKAGEKFTMKGMPKISRADVADFMIKQLTDPTYIRKSPILMN
ncbi:MAG: SDR family oxidoreductase [Ferruginibacter sp.]